MNVEIKIYRITGKQLFFKVPEFVCHECDTVVRMVERIEKRLDDKPITVKVFPWMNKIFSALKKGGWHPPVIMINDKIFSQGIVPDEKELEKKILEQFE